MYFAQLDGGSLSSIDRMTTSKNDPNTVSLLTAHRQTPTASQHVPERCDQGHGRSCVQNRTVTQIRLMARGHSLFRPIAKLRRRGFLANITPYVTCPNQSKPLPTHAELGQCLFGAGPYSMRVLWSEAGQTRKTGHHGFPRLSSRVLHSPQKQCRNPIAGQVGKRAVCPKCHNFTYSVQATRPNWTSSPTEFRRDQSPRIRSVAWFD